MLLTRVIQTFCKITPTINLKNRNFTKTTVTASVLLQNKPAFDYKAAAVNAIASFGIPVIDAFSQHSHIRTMLSGYLKNRSISFAAAKYGVNIRTAATAAKDTRTEKKAQPQENVKQVKKPLLDPNCKIAVVIGGTGGIGKATANMLLCHRAKHVALIGQNSQKGLEAVNNLNCAHGNGKSIFLTCDIRDRRAISNTFKLLKNEFNNLDMFVHCAGLWNDADWCRQLNVNVAGTINVNLEIAAIAPKTKAVVVNLTGNLGLETFPPSPIFAATNSAVVEFSRSFGHEMNAKKSGLRIVTVCTGITKTDFVKSLDKKMLTPEMGMDLNMLMKNLPTQNVDACAQAILDVIQNGENGSVWVIENSKLFAAKLSSWRGQSAVVSHYT